MSHVTLFLGITVTRTMRDSFFKRLTSNRVKSFCSLLESRCSGLMVWDNFQQGQERREQRGGCSSKFLIGMVEAAHRVLPFVNRFGFPNRKWDNRNMMMIYDREQSQSALPIMRTKIEDGMHKDKAGCMRLSAGGRKRGAAASVAGTRAGSQGWGASSGVAGDGDS